MHNKLQVINKKHKKLLKYIKKNSLTKEFRKIQRSLAESKSDESLNISNYDDSGSKIDVSFISGVSIDKND